MNVIKEKLNDYILYCVRYYRYYLPCMGSKMNLDRPQWWHDWKANEWIYECFTCLHHTAYAPTKKEILHQVTLHDKECLNGWA